MEKGDTVTFAEPADSVEQAARMTVVEVNGERVIVTDDSQAKWSIQPTYYYLASDLVKV